MTFIQIVIVSSICKLHHLVEKKKIGPGFTLLDIFMKAEEEIIKLHNI